MNNKFLNWFIFTILSFIWGSSFILMKEGMVGLNPWQVASIRIISSGLVLLPVALRSFKLVPRRKYFLTFLSGALGSLFPAYLFCIAEKEIDSALAGVLNSLTPIFVIIVGGLFFKVTTSAIKFLGILIAFLGTVLLFLNQPGFSSNSNSFSISLVVLATLMYGININLVRRYLHEIPSLHIAALALFLNSIPAAVVLVLTGYFSSDFHSGTVLVSTGWSMLLGIGGTAVASILFYMLIKRAGVVFSSMVTYAIPLVAIGWGIFYGEKIGWRQVLCMLVILAGVYIANLKSFPVLNRRNRAAT